MPFNDAREGHIGWQRWWWMRGASQKVRYATPATNQTT